MRLRRIGELIVRHNAMTASEYSAAMKRLSWRYGIIFCSVVVLGTLGALYLTDRLAASSSWPRENVFFAMLPALLAPTIIAGVLLEFADRRFGLKCPSCGHTLSFGRHVKRLLRDAGSCPWCRALVVDPRSGAEPGGAPNGGPATPAADSGVTEGPPSVT